MTLNSLKKQQAHADGVNWLTASVMVLFHIGAIAALFFFTWKAFFLSIFLWWISGSLGIGMGYHRLLTHRGYKTPKWVEYFLTICATLTLEGGPIFWVATHRIHHKYSDHEGDPHSPLDGKWWAHMGWILMGKSLHHDTTTQARYVPDLTRDKFHVWITKYHYVPADRARPLWCLRSAACPACSGEFSCAPSSACTPPGWSTPPRTRGVRAASSPAINPPTAGGSRCSPGAKAGTTTITRIRFPLATA